MLENCNFLENVKIAQQNFDDVMEEIGWFKKFTQRYFVLTYMIVVYGAMNIVASVFLSVDVSHYCKLDNKLIEDISKKCNLSWTDVDINLTVPYENNKLSQCKMYTSDALLNLTCSYWGSSEYANLTTEKCSNWIYDTSIFTSTSVMDFNLVCDNKWEKDLSQIILMFGVLIGATACGIASDRWGRRPSFITSLVILIASSILTSVARMYWLLIFARLFVGVGSIGLCISGVVYMMEITSVRHRVLINQALQATFSFGFMLLALFAFIERRWVYLNLYLAVPLIVLLPLYVWFSAESPRWLFAKNKPQIAIKVLQEMAKVNSKNFDDILNKLKLNKASLLKKIDPGSLDDYHIARINHTTLDLFRNPTLRFVSLILFYNWFTLTCIYYGLTLNTASLSGNIFFNFFLGGLVEIPANFGVVPIINLWGRRPVISLCNIICGISLFCMMFVPEDLVEFSILLFLVGKLGVTASFSCIYLYSSELYPTPLRGNGLGVCSGFSRLGGLVSLLIIMLRHIDHNLPFVVFGCIASVAGFLIVLLPETKGSLLPETIDDTVRLHTRSQVNLFKLFKPSSVRRCCAGT